MDDRLQLALELWPETLADYDYSIGSRSRSRSPLDRESPQLPRLHPEEYIGSLRKADLPPRKVGQHTFIECGPTPNTGTAHVLEEPLINQLEPCVCDDGDEHSGRLYMRRISKTDRKRLNDIIDTLIAEVESYAEKAHNKRPLRSQFFAERALDMERVEDRCVACYMSRNVKPKMCYWAPLRCTLGELLVLDLLSNCRLR